jgi:hypothetical protein
LSLEKRELLAKPDFTKGVGKRWKGYSNQTPEFVPFVTGWSVASGRGFQKRGVDEGVTTIVDTVWSVTFCF